MFDSATGDTVTIDSHDQFIEWFFEQYSRQKEKFEQTTDGTGKKETYTLETAFARYGFDDPLNYVCTAQFFDHRTRQILDLYEFYKYQPHIFSRSKLWREAVVIMRRLEPRGGLF